MEEELVVVDDEVNFERRQKAGAHQVNRRRNGSLSVPLPFRRKKKECTRSIQKPSQLSLSTGSRSFVQRTRRLHVITLAYMHVRTSGVLVGARFYQPRESRTRFRANPLELYPFISSTTSSTPYFQGGSRSFFLFFLPSHNFLDYLSFTFTVSIRRPAHPPSCHWAFSILSTAR